MARELARRVHVRGPDGLAYAYGPGPLDGLSKEEVEVIEKQVTNPMCWVDDEAPARNAKSDDWAKYADKRGVEVDDGASRGDIIEACEKAGLQV